MLDTRWPSHAVYRGYKTETLWSIWSCLYWNLWRWIQYGPHPLPHPLPHPSCV